MPIPLKIGGHDTDLLRNWESKRPFTSELPFWNKPKGINFIMYTQAPFPFLVLDWELWAYKMSEYINCHLYKEHVFTKTKVCTVVFMKWPSKTLFYLTRNVHKNPFMLQKACYMFRPCHCIRWTYILSVNMLWSAILWNDMISYDMFELDCVQKCVIHPSSEH